MVTPPVSHVAAVGLKGGWPGGQRRGGCRLEMGDKPHIPAAGLGPPQRQMGLQGGGQQRLSRGGGGVGGAVPRDTHRRHPLWATSHPSPVPSPPQQLQGTAPRRPPIAH